jgi:hypothetical protein
VLKSHWISSFLEFYGRNLFQAESSATCGALGLIEHVAQAVCYARVPRVRKMRAAWYGMRFVAPEPGGLL